MTTSDYLKIQTDLLIAVNQLRRLELERFMQAIQTAAGTGGVLLDHVGLPVKSDLEYMLHVAQQADQFRRAVAGYQAGVVRKPIQGERAEGAAAASDAA